MLNQFTHNKLVYWHNAPYLVEERLGQRHACLRNHSDTRPIAMLEELSPVDAALLQRPDLRRLHLHGAKAYDESTYDFYVRPLVAKYADKVLLEEALWALYNGELATLEGSAKVVLYERHKSSGEPESVGTAYFAEKTPTQPNGRACSLYSAGCIDWVLANMHLQAVEVRPHGLHGLTLYSFAHTPAPNDSGISHLDEVFDKDNPAVHGLVVAAHVMLLGTKYFVLDSGHYVREDNAQIMAKAPLPTVLPPTPAQV